MGQHSDDQSTTKADLNEVKIKTLEEIRAEKLARNQSPKRDEPSDHPEAPVEMPSLKREAPQSNRQIRIKRPRVSAEITAKAPPPCPAEGKSTEVNNHHDVVPAESAMANDEQVGNEEDGEEVANAGSLNDDELLLEIDNILGD